MEEKERVLKRGRPPKDKTRDSVVRFRLSTDEEQEFEKRFKASNLSTKTEFIKACIFEKEIKAPEMPLITFYNLIGNLVREINKSGHNMNQITKKINSLLPSESSMKLVSYELNKVLEEQLFMRQLTLKIVEYLDDFRRKYMRK